MNNTSKLSTPAQFIENLKYHNVNLFIFSHYKQMMAMQQQQQQQQAQAQPGMTPMQAPQQRNVMSMRRMSSGMQGPPQGPAPQYGSYPQY